MTKLGLKSRFWKFILRKTFKEKHLTIAEYRAQSASTAKFASRPPKGMHIEHITVDDLAAAWIRPADADKSKVVLHLHGGGYVTGSIASHLMMCIPMAQTLKMNVLLPEYRLAPEHPFPAAIDDVLKIYHWLLTQGYAANDIIISGDSAGGGLGVAVVAALRDQNEALPAAMICISPWADLTMEGRSHSTRAKAEAVLNADVLREWALCYTNESNLSNPLVSPIFANLRDFPPLLIQVGSDEILVDDAIALAEKAKSAGVDVTLKIWDGMWHVWQALGDLIPESEKSFEEIRQFIQEHTHAQK